MKQTIERIVRFYVDGFRSMTVGRTLWAIILVKLFVIFAVLKLFFFPDFLAGKSDEERSRHVMAELAAPECARDGDPQGSGAAGASAAAEAHEDDNVPTTFIE